MVTNAKGRSSPVSHMVRMAVLFLLVFAGAFGVSAVDANAASNRVEKACERDYYRYCSAYSIGSSKLRQCFKSNGKRLTRRCMRALVDAGYVSRRKLKRRRRRR